MIFNLRVLVVFFLLYSIFSCNQGGKHTKERFLIGNDYKDIKSTEGKRLLKLGDTNIKSQNYETALEYYLKANTVEPGNATILNSIANTECILGQTEEASSHFQKAISIDSSYLQAYASYGTSLGENKRYEEAVKILKLGFEKSSPNQFVYYALSFNLSIYYYKMGNCKKAGDYIKIALENKFKNENFDNETKKTAEIIKENCRS